MSKIQKLGASNKFFYYAMGEHSTFNIRFTLGIPNLDMDAMKSSFNEAIVRYPELGVQVYIKDNKLTSKVNDKDIVFRKYGSAPVCFGTDDTNGFLFYVLYAPDEITVSYYHGMTDVSGMLELLRCVMYIYSQKIGFELSTEELDELLPTIRNKSALDDTKDEDDLLDPYNKYADVAAVPEYVFDNKGAFKMPIKEDSVLEEYCHSAQIRFSFDALAKKAKDMGVSITPFLLDTAIRGVFDAFNVGDETVITMLPVDQRKFFDSHTVVNCSDSIFLSFTDKDMNLPIDQRCLRVKDLIKKQTTKNNFAKMMSDKACAVASFEKSDVPITQQLINSNTPQPSDFNPLTVVTTPIGKMTLLSGLDRLMSDFDVCGYAKGNAVIMRICKDEVRFQILSISESDVLEKAIFDILDKEGYNPKLEGNNKFYQDFMMSERLCNE